MVKLPKLKKDVNAFLVGEEGKISKQALMKAGTIFAISSIGTLLNVNNVEAPGPTYTHGNTISMNWDSSSWTVSGTHSNHGSHGSHGSHSSHGQW